MVLVGEIVPQPGEHAVPPCVSVQVTPRMGVPVTVAVNVCVWPTPTLAVEGETVTVIGRTIRVVVPQPVRYRNRPIAGNRSDSRRMKNLAMDWEGVFLNGKEIRQNSKGARAAFPLDLAKQETDVQGDLGITAGAFAIRKTPQSRTRQRDK